MSDQELQQAYQQVMDPATIRKSGAGKAFQSVSQSMAIAVQDGTDYLRNIEAISLSVIGIAAAQLVATQDLKWVPIIEQGEKILAKGIENFAKIGAAAAKIETDFPSS